MLPNLFRDDSFGYDQRISSPAVIQHLIVTGPSMHHSFQVLILGSYPNADLAPFVQKMSEEHPRLTVRYLQV